MWWQRPPLFAYFLLAAAGGMLLPMLHAARTGQPRIAAIFLVSAAGCLLAAALLTLALMNRNPRITARAQLGTLLLGYLLMPLVAAVPLHLAMPGLGFEPAWFEMVSCLTTTGATLLDPASVAPSLHLWRATVGWLGGFLIVLSALAIMAPLNLGGFEMQSVIHGARPGEGWASLGVAEASARLLRSTLVLLPVYVGLTATLAFLLAVVGEAPLDAVIHAMSVLSTSGISARADGLGAGGAGRLAEAVTVVFLVLAATSRGPRIRFSRADLQWLRSDAELRIMLWAVVIATLVLALRMQPDDTGIAGQLWGAGFTALSFLTTTGFVADDWSGDSGSAMALLVLATLGGGIASTAGGIKLLRAYALIEQGRRELGRLIHPNSLGGGGEAARRLRQAGAYLAWVFLMLFLLALAVIFMALSLAGLDFEAALALAIAALTNAGPAYPLAAPGGPPLAEIGAPARGLAALAMVMGRLEALAVLALLNPENWRR
ncbi:MAG: TrkH family potassium uptake protein [Alphaproteobacteria bacterium]|nr:MAG: TrkH family potassium uptake protein [Alphaproteobacteria bacterium]